jgi:transposase
LRRRVIGFVEAGGSRREAAEQFDIGVSPAIRWMQRFREDGTCEPMPRGRLSGALSSEQSDTASERSRAVDRRFVRLPGVTQAQYDEALRRLTNGGTLRSLSDYPVKGLLGSSTCWNRRRT